MRSITITSESPFTAGMTQYDVIIEDDRGYRESQAFACLPEERDAKLAEALSAFCIARDALGSDPLPRP